jgi:anthraniloyl-CoA monooxygenase
VVESVQRAAEVSLQWFEQAERYLEHLDPLRFTFSMLTRSLRITHLNLKRRDPALIEQVNRAVASSAATQSGATLRLGRGGTPPPPMFTPFRLRDLVLDNRIVVSPMSMYCATAGEVGEFHLVHLGSRALGGAGLVLAEMSAVSADARITPNCAGLYLERHAQAWRRVVAAIHAGGARSGIQIGHAGRKGATRPLSEGIDEPLPREQAWPLVSASAIPWHDDRSQRPSELDRAGMISIRDAHVHATEMAILAGFDLLELHMAHGYLLSSFISPLTNHRNDSYGGSLDNRLRFPLEVLQAVRAAWPAERPLAVRISACDWVDGGLTPADAIAVAQALAHAGCDLIDVSAGQVVPYQQPRYGRLFQTPFAEQIRLEVGIATMAVGAISTYEDVNSIIAANRADLCAIARAHLWDPYWTRHAAYSQDYPLPWPAQYSSLARYRPIGWGGSES